MRSIASCYSDHAVKVSDSYCSGPSQHGYVISSYAPPTQNPHTVTCFYRVKVSTQKQFLIILSWGSDRIRQGFNINIHSNSHRLIGVKGTKSFKSNNSEISLFWDLSEARFDPGPDPSIGFYVAVLVDSEIGLFLGDKKDKFLKLGIWDSRIETQIPKFCLVSRRERIFGEESVYSTKARFSEEGSVHEISLKCGGDGDGDGDGDEGEGGMRNQTLLVFIDKKKIFQVNRLRWNFRGNQTIFIDGSVVDMMWDVHDWFFKSKSGFGVFMFRRRSGLNSRLWLEEKKQQEGLGFSLTLTVCKNSHY